MQNLEIILCNVDQVTCIVSPLISEMRFPSFKDQADYIYMNKNNQKMNYGTLLSNS